MKKRACIPGCSCWNERLPHPVFELEHNASKHDQSGVWPGQFEMPQRWPLRARCVVITCTVLRCSDLLSQARRIARYRELRVHSPGSPLLITCLRQQVGMSKTPLIMSFPWQHVDERFRTLCWSDSFESWTRSPGARWSATPTSNGCGQRENTFKMLSGAPFSRVVRLLAHNRAGWTGLMETSLTTGTFPRREPSPRNVRITIILANKIN